MNSIQNLTGAVLAGLRAQRRSTTPNTTEQCGSGDTPLFPSAPPPGHPPLRHPARVTADQIADCFAAFDDGEAISGHPDPELRKMLAAAVRFCAAMASATAPPHWLTLLGDPGCGKTMLARCVIRFFRRHLEGLPDENFAREIRHRGGGLKLWGDQVLDMVAGDYTGLRNLREDWLVCLDDIGVEHTRHAELSRAKLFDVLNARLGRWTLITANLTLEEIRDRVDPRISSRLLRDHSEVIDSQAIDYATRR